jgi:2',3'-cyclic-nucleotide 2'-phosphodiesterase (5'-nucleotidase family)
LIVDNDAEATQATIDQMQALMARRPDIIVVPAHDGVVQKVIGYFPAWAK